MKTVLCFGDSNTYGYNPENGLRYPSNVRWTGRLQAILGDEYRVIEEGCNGRTTVFEDPIEGWKAGLGYLRPCLNSHKPVDIVIMMLGSNDLKEYFHASAAEIAEGAATLVRNIIDFTDEKQGFIPKIILVSPPEIGEGIESSPFFGSFSLNAIERSREFPVEYLKVAEKYGCIFFDAASVIKPSEIDSLHLSAEAHGIFAEEIAKTVKAIKA